MKKVIGFMLFLIILHPTQSLALSCVQPPSVEKAYEKYDGVIIGTVKEVKSGLNNKEITIKVDTSFKGVEKSWITVTEDKTWGRSEKNNTYLFYLTKENFSWKHQLCTPTERVVKGSNELKEDLQFLADKGKIELKKVNPPKDYTMIWIVTGVLAVLILIRFFKKKQT